MVAGAVDLFFLLMTFKQAQNLAFWLLLVSNVGILGFHVCVLTGIVSYSIVWGGRLKSAAEMVQFESFSIGLNLFFSTVLLAKKGWLPVRIAPKWVRGILWAMCGMLALNTVGNLFSISSFEAWVFTPATLLLSVCAGLLAVEK
jgi:hypothetical protein